MANKILVAYTTFTGSTKGVAEAIGASLTTQGEAVEVLPMAEVKDTTDYKMVFAGSPIHNHEWLPEATGFLEKHRDDLNKKPFAPFLLCMTLAMKNGEKYVDTVSTWMDPIRRTVKPVGVGLFKGVLDIKKIPSFKDRMIFRISVLFGVWKEGDHREWDQIDGWAKSMLKVGQKV